MSKLFTLQDYIMHKGVTKVAEEVGCDRQAVYQWKELSTAPRPAVAAKLIELSGGLLSFEGIYRPFVEHQKIEQLSFEMGE